MTDLSTSAWPEVPRGALLVVPLGSCEQHGPHLPLDVDLRIAVHLARRLCASRPDALMGPPIPVGASGEHAGFPGTLSIGTEALVTVLVELARSAVPDPAAAAAGRDPFRAVLVVNGHGGNVEACGRAAGLLAEEGRDLGVWHPVVPGGDSHAGRTETSMVLHLCPEVVRRDRVEVGSTARWREIGDTVRRDGLAAVTPNGVLGDPRAATAEEGERVLDDLVRALVAHVERWAGPAVTPST